MKRSTWRLTSTAAVVLTGLVALTGAAPALAQGKPKAPPAAPAKATPPPGKKPAKAPPAPKPLTDKQKKDLARKAYKAGEAKFKAGDYKGALAEYQVADDVLPIPATKYKLAVCRDKLGEIVQAAAAYQVFLDGSPPLDKMADAIAESKARLEALKKTPGKLRMIFEPANLPKLAVSIDDAPPKAASSLPRETVTPQPAPVAAPDPKAPPPPPPPSFQASTATVPPGKHRITATADGYDPAKAEVEVPFAGAADVKLELHKTAPPPPPPPPLVVAPPPVAQVPAPPPPKPRRSNVPAYVTFGLAGAGFITGGAFGSLAYTAKRNFDHNPSERYADKAENLARGADIALGIGLAAGVTGAVLMLTNLPSRAPQTGEQAPAKSAVSGFVTPWFGPQAGGAAAVVSF